MKGSAVIDTLTGVSAKKKRNNPADTNAPSQKGGTEDYAKAFGLPWLERENGWLKSQFTQRPKPTWVVDMAHALVLGALLLLYALPHHVLPSVQQDTGIVSTWAAVRQKAEPVVTTVPAPVESASAVVASATVQPEATPEPVGSFRNKFADKFTDGKVIQTNNT